MKRFLFLMIVAASVVLYSCSKDEVIVQQTTTTLAKHWFVRMQGPVSTSNYSLFSTRTHNLVDSVTTKISTDTLSLDDHNLLSPTFRSNVKIDVNALSFKAAQYRNWHSSDSLIVKEGKIFINGGRSRTGNTVDSIYLKVAFRSAPATDYIIKGHGRTGLLADEY